LRRHSSPLTENRDHSPLRIAIADARGRPDRTRHHGDRTSASPLQRGAAPTHAPAPASRRSRNSRRGQIRLRARGMVQHPPPAAQPDAAATGREQGARRRAQGGRRGRETARRGQNPREGSGLGGHGWLDRGSRSREVVGIIIFLYLFSVSGFMGARSSSVQEEPRKRFLEGTVSKNLRR
jgi:hypothetical protein